MTIDDNNPFRLSADEMRRIGYAVIDRIVERFEAMHAGQVPPVEVGDGAELRARLEETIPEQGQPFEAIMDRVCDDVFRYGVRLAHPRFFAFIASPSNYISAVADMLTAGYNPFVGTWLGGSGPSQLELVTIDWLCSLCGYPAESGGLFVSGGSQANLTALAVARHVKAPTGFADAVVYFGDQVHYSNTRALRTLGFAPSQLRSIASTDDYRMDVGALEAAIKEDLSGGRLPLCVVATAGTTNVGAVDPLREIARICQECDAWLHVDGAFGAAAMISPKLRSQFDGIEMADSLTVDPHKWMFQPFEIGGVLVRNREQLRDTFQVMPDYLKDVHRLGEVNFADHGVQLTRGFRALKLWMSLHYYGAGAFREGVEKGVALAEYAESLLRSRRVWQVLSPARLATVAFRYVGDIGEDRRRNEVNDSIVAAATADGHLMLSSTILSGQTALRFCTINPATTERDMETSIERLEALAALAATS